MESPSHAPVDLSGPQAANRARSRLSSGARSLIVSAPRGRDDHLCMDVQAPLAALSTYRSAGPGHSDCGSALRMTVPRAGHAGSHYRRFLISLTKIQISQRPPVMQTKTTSSKKLRMPYLRAAMKTKVAAGRSSDDQSTSAARALPGRREVTSRGRPPVNEASWRFAASDNLLHEGSRLDVHRASMRTRESPR